jgi:hypothetical protein
LVAPAFSVCTPEKTLSRMHTLDTVPSLSLALDANFFNLTACFQNPVRIG